MTDLEADWEELVLLRPVPPEATGQLLDDLVEDGDQLQGRSSWFVALYDKDLKRIHGTVLRTSSLQCDVQWPALAVAGTAVHVGYWMRGRPVSFVRLTTEAELEIGHGVVVTLYVHFFSTASTSNFVFTIPVSNVTSNTITFSTFT
jgi:hypothetical protein